MKRVSAKKAKQETKNVIEILKKKYDFLTDDFLKKINDDNLNIDDVIRIISVLQYDVFKIPNNIISIKEVSTLGAVPWTIGDVFLYEIEGRFAVLHFKDATTILHKDSSGAPITKNVAKFLPQHLAVKSNTVYDGSYNHLLPISNVEIIVRAPSDGNSFQTYNGFTKSRDVVEFRARLFRALQSVQLTGYIAKELGEIEKNVAFKQKLKQFIQESLKYGVISSLAKEYDRVLTNETVAFEKEGKPMDESKIEASRRALNNAAKEYPKDTLQIDSDSKNQDEQYCHIIEKEFPKESVHFTNIFTYLDKYDVDEKYMNAIEMICVKLDLNYNDVKKFYDVYKDMRKKPEIITPSKPISEGTDAILVKYAELAEVRRKIDPDILTLEQVLEEVKMKNGLNDNDVLYLNVLYNKTLGIFNKNWTNSTTKEVYDWAKEKRGKLKPTDICDAMAVCIRAHQIVSKGVITLRDVQILSALMFLSTTKGNFAEISTGEGKTIIISTLVVVKVLQGMHVDIITSNEVLADEGLNSMRDFYYLFNIHASTNNFDPTYKEGPRACYSYDVVYGNIGNFQFDYLRDSFEDDRTRGGRGFNFLILDEVDSLTIDNGTYIAKLAQPFPGVECLRYIYIQIWIMLHKAEEEYQASVYKELEVVVGQKGNKTDDEMQEAYDQHFLERVSAMPANLKRRIKDMKPLDIPVIPNHLKTYCKEMLDKWIDNALYAKYHCHENEDYIVKKIKKLGQNEEETAIVPVDYANTGVTLSNTIWSNGLHQFVQLKHNIKLTSETLTASFISNLGYIRLYNNNMYGMTGTLGSKAEQTFLSSIYDLKYMRIPTFKPKHFTELDGIVVRDAAWVSCVILDAYLKVKEERSVLIICETISDVQILKENLDALQELEDAKWIETRYYYDESYSKLVLRDRVGSCEIIVATNIAGRGTDFKSTKYLESRGGLHVCATYLPCNERVEQQAFGRTSRQGNFGTAQLIIRESDVLSLNYHISSSSSTMQHIKDHRDHLELEKLTAMKDGKIKEILFQDRLFQEFSKTYTNFLRKQQKIKGGIFLTLDLKERWAFWLRSQNYKGTEYVAVEYEKFLALAKPILDGKISFNPYYAVKQADYFIKKDNFKDAKVAIERAISISKSDSYIYPAYLKLFEICILDGGAVLHRFLRALMKFVCIPPSDHAMAYKDDATEALRKAHLGIAAEVDYIKTHIIENKHFHSILFTEPGAPNENPTKNEGDVINQRNVLLRHIISRYYALMTFQNHIVSLQDQIKGIGGGVAFNGKVENYLKELKPTNEDERMLRKNILDDELIELNNVAVSTIYNLREVYDVSDVVIIGAQLQIAAGLGILVGCLFFPPAFFVGGPAAGALIGEGITDIVIDLIKQGDEKFDLQSYIKGKCVGYLVAAIGFSLVAQSIKLLKVALKTSLGLARFLKNSTRLNGVFGKLAAVFQKFSVKLTNKISKLSPAQSLFRSQAIKIGLKHVGVATGINLAGALLGEFVVAKTIAAILEASNGQILNNVLAVVNEKFADNLQHVNRQKLAVILEDLSRGTIGQLSWEIFIDTVSSLVQTCHSWKIKIAGFTLFSVVRGSEIGKYAHQYCDETIKLMEMDATVENSEQNIKDLKLLIAGSITDDICRRILALANSATHNFIVNPMMSKAIRKTMKKFSGPRQDDVDLDTKKPSFKEVSDAYKQLELAEGASEKEINTAFRAMAKKYHPDSRQLPNAEKFIAIENAKSVLLKLQSSETNMAKPSSSKALALPAPVDLPMGHKGNIETLSRSTGQYIVVRNEKTGETTQFGYDYGGQPVEVHYRPPKGGSPGHYFAAGHEDTLIPSANNNCLYDSLALVMNENGRDVTADGLRIKATSLSFANLKYNAISDLSQVFNNKFTRDLYNNIQGHILIGAGGPTKLSGDTYPSGIIKIKTSNDTKEAILHFETTIFDHYENAKNAKVVAPKDLKNGDISRITMSETVTGQDTIPVLCFIPAKEKDRKAAFMMGALHVEFLDYPPLKLVTASGLTPLKTAIVKAEDGVGPFLFNGTRYKTKSLEYEHNGFKFIDPGKLQVKEIFDVYQRQMKNLNGGILGRGETEPTSSCAATKLLYSLAEHMKKHNLTIKGDIHMVEAYFNPENGKVVRNSIKDLIIEDSCSKCKIILPQITGADKGIKEEKK